MAPFRHFVTVAFSPAEISPSPRYSDGVAGVKMRKIRKTQFHKPRRGFHEDDYPLLETPGPVVVTDVVTPTAELPVLTNEEVTETISGTWLKPADPQEDLIPVGAPKGRSPRPSRGFGSAGRRGPSPTTIFVLLLGTVFAASALGGSVLRLVRASDPGLQLASAVVGEAGGRIRFGDGGVILIPSGALDRDETISVREVDVVDVQPTVDAAGRVFVFLPANLQFKIPVTVVFPPPATARRGEIFVLSDGDAKAVKKSGSQRILTVRTFDLSFRKLAPAAGPEFSSPPSLAGTPVPGQITPAPNLVVTPDPSQVVTPDPNQAGPLQP